MARKKSKRTTRKKATRKKATSSTRSTISKKKSKRKREPETRKRKETSRKKASGKGKASKGSGKRKEVSSKRKPANFTVVPGQEEARDKIQTRLSETAMYLEGEGIEARVYVHSYRGGQVDGELTVFVPRGMESEELGRKLAEAFGQDPGGLGRGFWFSLGARAAIKEDETVYRRFKGMNEIGMYYRRVKSAKLMDNFLSLYSFRVSKKTGTRHAPLLEAIEEKYRRKVQTVYIRLNWNPEDEQPKR